MIDFAWLKEMPGLPAGPLQAVSETLKVSDYIALVSGFGGTLLGATIGAIVSLLAARRTSRDAVERDRAAKVDAQKAAALRLLIKSSVILADLEATVRAIHESLNAANDRRLTSQQLWQRVQPILGSAGNTSIDVDELAPFIAAKEYDLVGDFIELSMQHSVLNESIVMYNNMRMGLKDKIDGADVLSDGLLGTDLSPEQARKLAPLFSELNSLISSIRSKSEELVEAASSVAKAIGPAAQRYFNDPSFPGLRVVPLDRVKGETSA